MIVCLWTPDWPADLSGSPLPAELLAIVPRITLADDVVWADVRGLPESLADTLVERAAACGITGMRAGMAAVPIVAELLAKSAVVGQVNRDTRISELPLGLICADQRLLLLLEGVGVRTCGEFAALDREAVEVRFGAEAVLIWKWSQGEDERRVFTTSPPERLHASTDFIDYVVTDPERLVFVANALFATVCDQLRERGQHARRIRMTLSLANPSSWQRTIRPARPTASRAVWLRLARALLEKLTVPDAVTGVLIEVEAIETAAAVQGDLFDVGFATAAALDSAVGRLIEMQGSILVKPVSSRHPLAEKRTQWQADELTAKLSDMAPAVIPAELRLQLLEQPREVLVETVQRRDHVVPIRYRHTEPAHHADRWHQIASLAGPDRISGGKWEAAYAREYFRAVTVEGEMVWLYRDARVEKWYIQGYWD